VVQDEVGALDRRSAVRENVRRHRARQRLMALLSAVLAAAVATTKRVAAVPAMSLALVCVGIIGITAIEPPAFRQTPPTQSASGAAVSDQTRESRHDHAPFVPTLTMMERRAAVGIDAQRTLPPDPAIRAPTGDRLTVTSSDDRPESGAIICISGIPYIAPRCISHPAVPAGTIWAPTQVASTAGR
jgi:hypothetical protein